MPVPVLYHPDLKVVVASLCGALVWGLNQRYFDRKKQSVAFVISFVMGILGADVTLEVVNIIFPGVFSGERAIGAFLCSALIITLVTGLIHRISLLQNNQVKEK
ncbi:putative holin [Pantoea sp. AS142]|uniref:putative holin n=1 Tax=Pantoea sp. AS142 TaxID=3081292 RepID=UPI003017DD6B